MSDLISRQAAIDICANAIDLWRGQLGEGALIAVRDKIKELPPAEPKRMRGYWTPRDFNKRNGNISTCAYYFPTCSICRNVGDERFAFCPNCGADMRGEQDE